MTKVIIITLKIGSAMLGGISLSEIKMCVCVCVIRVRESHVNIIYPEGSHAVKSILNITHAVPGKMWR